MCIPQGLSIMNYQELMKLIMQAEKYVLVMRKPGDLVPAVCSWIIFKSPSFKSKPTK